MTYIPRKCTEIVEDGNSGDKPPLSSRPLEEFRDTGAYVLLGAPGAGKTTEFEKEADKKENFHYITARNFILDDLPAECHDKTLFIDGLDEIRAGKHDQRTPFDKIRSNLLKLGCPRFRLSCREADWFGTNDSEHLKYVSPDENIRILRLDPLSDDDIIQILSCNHNLDKPESFVSSAHERGIGALLANPQSLGMLVYAVANGEKWPSTRIETFDLACRRLIGEHNQEHKLVNSVADVPSLFNVAGKLCAIQLLTGHAGYAFATNKINRDYIDIEFIPSDENKTSHHVLRTKLFESTFEGHVTPTHRHIAEFLGGWYLAELAGKNIPVGRILSLMTGYDGGVVAELRGLSSWIAAHSKLSRREIIQRDPLGTVIYGDIGSFSTEEKLQILICLKQEAQENPWLFTIKDSRLADLVSPDTENFFQEFLACRIRDDSHQSFVAFLLGSLLYSRTNFPRLKDVLIDVLIDVVRDERWWLRIRKDALDVIIQQSRNDKDLLRKLKKLLSDVNSGSIPDPNDELLGRLLKELYPNSLPDNEIWKYLRMPKNSNFIGHYELFWFQDIGENLTTAQFATLFHEFAENFDSLLNEYANNETRFPLFRYVLHRLLERSGEFNKASEITEDSTHKINLSKKAIKEKLGNHPVFKYISLLPVEYPPTVEHRNRTEEAEKELQTEIRKFQLALIDFVRSHRETLAKNEGDPHALHELAKVYFRHFTNFKGDTPSDRLRNFLGNDDNLVNTVIKGLQGSVVRTDIPNETEIIKLRESNSTHYLALPFLAGLEEVFKNISESCEIPIGEKQSRQALAFYYNAQLPKSLSDSPPFWYKTLIRTNPKVVSDIFVKSALSRIHNGEESLTDLYNLLPEENVNVTRRVSMTLLEKFPVRCKSKQIKALRSLLIATILRCDEKPFLLKIVRKKLSYRSMNIAQRVHWLTAGLIVSPSSFYERSLEKYLKNHERRIQNLCEFIISFPEELIKRLGVQALKLMIQLVGPYHELISSGSLQSGSIDTPVRIGNLVYGLIQRLASIPYPEATEAFEYILDSDVLNSRRSDLQNALYKQKSVRRESDFSHCTIDQVLQTLSNKKPANAADLSALTMDILNELATNIRNGPTSDWRQYWNMDRDKPSTPLFENFCRDALLSDLRARLNHLGIGVTAHQEHTYADDKRSDVCVECDGYNVPVEIKKSDHDDLWNSAKNQLIAKYTKDPKTDGYGIYLVFWFGKELCKRPKSRPRPETADELKKLLYDNLADDQKRKISICVIDVEKH